MFFVPDYLLSRAAFPLGEEGTIASSLNSTYESSYGSQEESQNFDTSGAVGYKLTSTWGARMRSLEYSGLKRISPC